MSDSQPISLNQITQAAERIHGHAVLTPLIENTKLNELAGAKVYVKAENLQRTGSFKFRGAFNTLAKLRNEQSDAEHVLAWSSGNHAQGVACAAQLLGFQAHIVMPADAPLIKKRNTESYGAKVIEYDRHSENREDIGRTLAAQLNAVVIPPYDDINIMAGQGTCGLEIFQQSKSCDVTLDALLTCCGGGGLTAGVASTFAALSPATHIYAVEPYDFNDHQRSLEAGQRVEINPENRSICDALLAPTPGQLTFPINQSLLTEVLSVTDEQVIEAIHFAFTELKLVVEPGGAVALAAVLAGKLNPTYQQIGLILSGGNVDPNQMADYLSAS